MYPKTSMPKKINIIIGPILGGAFSRVQATLTQIQTHLATILGEKNESMKFQNQSWKSMSNYFQIEKQRSYLLRFRGQLTWAALEEETTLPGTPTE
jgi:hypothetical protein